MMATLVSLVPSGTSDPSHRQWCARAMNKKARRSHAIGISPISIPPSHPETARRWRRGGEQVGGQGVEFGVGLPLMAVIARAAGLCLQPWRRSWL